MAIGNRRKVQETQLRLLYSKTMDKKLTLDGLKELNREDNLIGPDQRKQDAMQNERQKRQREEDAL